jgi:hypothetical protein
MECERKVTYVTNRSSLLRVSFSAIYMLDVGVSYLEAMVVKRWTIYGLEVHDIVRCLIETALAMHD